MIHSSFNLFCAKPDGHTALLILASKYSRADLNHGLYSSIDDNKTLQFNKKLSEWLEHESTGFSGNS